MPICTNCTHPTPYLYTVYSSQDNLRLKQCPECEAFADPYVEHDALTLWIDLILLKRDVYRHLLFNRGAGARRLNPDSRKAESEGESESQLADVERRREKKRWIQICRLGIVLIAVDAFIRWTHISTSMAPNRNRHPAYVDVARWNQDALECYFRILIGCLIETVGFHTGVTLASFIVLHTLDWVRTFQRTPSKPSGLRLQFRYSHIPLTIFYSSLNKFFLLFLLTIWRPKSEWQGGESEESTPGLAPQYNASEMFTNPLVVQALMMLDDDKLDREWIVRNILGGMATGFGLRVVLDCHPVFTTMIILTGWAVKTALAHLVSGWVGASIGGEGVERVAEEMWLAYSIP